jgi:hypothetical protein
MRWNFTVLWEIFSGITDRLESVEGIIGLAGKPGPVQLLDAK